MTVLHIDTSAQTEGSNSRILSQYLIEQLNQPVIQRNLALNPLPPISSEDLIDLHASNEVSRESLRQHQAISQELIEELKSADTLVLGLAMYNFGVPVVLKQWIDAICRAGHTFNYTEQGPVGLTGVKRAFIVTASGGTPIGSEMDFASRYVEHICHFLGIHDVTHIDASGSKRTPELVIEEGKRQIDAVLTDTVEPEKISA